MSASAPDNPPAGVLGSVMNGLRFIEVIAEEPRPLREVSVELGLPRQTVYRLARTMVEAGWVLRSGDQCYRMTRHFWSVAQHAFDHGDIQSRLSPVLRRLAETSGETVHLAVYESGYAVYVDKAEGSEPIRAYSKIGGRGPAHCVATGKMLLAHQDQKEIDSVLDGSLEQFGPNTLDREALAKELRHVRSQGWARNRGEWRASVGGIAVPLVDWRGNVIAAVGFSGPVERIQQREDELRAMLHDTVAALDLAGGGVE